METKVLAVAEEQERYLLTLEAMEEVEQGKTIPYGEVKQWLLKCKYQTQEQALKHRDD
ncbi:MAG: hypothetical protein WCK42_00425 [Myxococcaceae bacterium]